VQDIADHTSIVGPARTRLVLWKVRLDRRPSLVIQPEKAGSSWPPPQNGGRNLIFY
jgi:hypothetical protein